MSRAGAAEASVAVVRARRRVLACIVRDSAGVVKGWQEGRVSQVIQPLTSREVAVRLGCDWEWHKGGGNLGKSCFRRALYILTTRRRRNLQCNVLGPKGSVISGTHQAPFEIICQEVERRETARDFWMVWLQIMRSTLNELTKFIYCGEKQERAHINPGNFLENIAAWAINSGRGPRNLSPSDVSSS